MAIEVGEIVKRRVSVVTSVYNGEQFLGRFLDSLLAQTYTDMELILVDDGSDDHTLDVAASYTDAFYRKGYNFKIIKAEHKNASAAINRGLQYVKGEYLIWPDSDDVLEPESVEKRVHFLQNHSEYECVRSIAYYFDDKTGKPARPDEQKGSFIKEELFWDILESKTFVCCGCYMLKSEVFFRIYPEKKIPEYDVGQNFQMLLPYLYSNKCYTIPEELYGVSVRRDSHSRIPLTRKQETIKFQNYEKLVDEICDICHLNQEERERIYFWKLKRRYWLAMKYKDKKQAASYIFYSFRKKKISFVKMMKQVIWLYAEHKWVKEILQHCNRCLNIIANKLWFLTKKQGEWSELPNEKFTIISNNCWGGLIYQKYGIKYQTPTIGLVIIGADYVKFCEKLFYYLEVPLKFIPWEQRTYYRDWTDEKFPVGKLEDIEIYFLHYDSEREALEKWERRKRRIQPEHILFKLSQREECSKDDVIRFMNMPYKNKICFAYDKVPETIYIPELKGYRGDEFSLLEKYFDEFPVLQSL